MHDELRRGRGQSMVELALLMPVLLWICAGIVDFGRVYYYDIVSINAARVGARAASNIWTTDSAVTAAVQADLANTFSPGTPPTITISPSGTRTGGQTVTVTVQYSFAPFTPIIASLFPGGQLTVSRSASMVAS